MRRSKPPAAIGSCSAGARTNPRAERGRRGRPGHRHQHPDSQSPPRCPTVSYCSMRCGVFAGLSLQLPCSGMGIFSHCGNPPARLGVLQPCSPCWKMLSLKYVHARARSRQSGMFPDGLGLLLWHAVPELDTFPYQSSARGFTGAVAQLGATVLDVPLLWQQPWAMRGQTCWSCYQKSETTP